MRNIFKISITIILITFLSIPHYYAQKPPGFIGKRNILALNLTGSMRVLSGAMAEGSGFQRTVYDPNEDSQSLSLTGHLFRSGINTEYFRILGRNFGLGLKFQYNKISLSTGSDLRSFDHADSNFFTTYYINSSSAVFNSYAFKPSIVFNSKPGFLPIGLRHTISIGALFASLNTNKDYFYELQYDETGFPSDDNPEIIPKPDEDFSNKFRGIDFGYNGSITYPISNALMFEVGYEFRLSVLMPDPESIEENRKFFQNDNSIESSLSEGYYNRDYISEVGVEVIGRIFSMNMGLVYAF